ncbi:MAG: hypothetical protein ACLUCZ_17435 [Thomasclavelia ramosa]|nr:hypothetical protein [Lactobacillus kalixensis]
MAEDKSKKIKQTKNSKMMIKTIYDKINNIVYEEENPTKRVDSERFYYTQREIGRMTRSSRNFVVTELTPHLHYVYLNPRYSTIYKAFFNPGAVDDLNFPRKERIFYSTKETEDLINSSFIPARRSIFVPWEEIFTKKQYYDFIRDYLKWHFTADEDKKIDITKYVKVDYHKPEVKKLLDNLYYMNPVAFTKYNHWQLVSDQLALPLTLMYRKANKNTGMDVFNRLDSHELHGYSPFTTSDSWSGSEAQQTMVKQGSQLYVHNRDGKGKNTKTLFYLDQPKNVPESSRFAEDPKDPSEIRYIDKLLHLGMLAPAHLYCDFKKIPYDYL